MARRPLYDTFVILIFVTTGKLHCYWFSLFLDRTLNDQKNYSNFLYVLHLYTTLTNSSLI